MKIKIQKHQTLLDVVIQYCGSAEALFAIAELNDLEPTEDVAPGTELLIPGYFNEVVTKYLDKNGYKLTTGPLDFDAAKEGLEYWAIENDFKIS